MKKIFLNNLLIILIFFFIFEIFLRLFGLADLRGHGNELKKRQTNVETTVFGKKVFLDKYGYRVPYIKFEYQNNQNKIIFIGDSVLFGSGVNEEETFLGKLRKFDKNRSYINAAVIGNDIIQNSSDIEKNYKLFESNELFIILTLDDINNFEDDQNSKKKNQGETSFIQSLKNNYFLSRINLFLRTKSYTYLWIKGITTDPSKRYFFESFNQYKEEEKIKFFKLKIDEIKNIEKIKKLNLKFIILPYEYQTRMDCNKELLIPQEKIEAILNARNLNYINLSKYFCNYSNPKKLFLNFDPVHLSPLGHELVFSYIKKELG